MSSPRRIYLDNAATSWPKPETVYQAVEQFQREIGAPAGRGAYAEAALVARRIERARQLALELVNAAGDYSVVFTPNCTTALNLAIHGLLRPGDHVVSTAVEHNSILRPLRAEADEREVRVTFVDCDDQGLVDPEAIRRALLPGTRLVAVSHASNVTGTIQPVQAIGEIVRAHGARFLVDAAQTMGHWPLDLGAVKADFVAAAGHKGLLSPLGVGLLYLRREHANELKPILQGGTGSQSQFDLQPAELPERFESGNVDVPAIFGLAAGLEYVLAAGVEKLAKHSELLTEQLLVGLVQIPEVHVYGLQDAAQRVGVVSFNIEGYDPQEVASALEATQRIQVRAGLHCAGRLHERLGTFAAGGTVRVSFGPFNQASDVETLLQTVAEIAAAQRIT